MCDFKPGDEVVCVDAGLQWGFEPCPLVKGAHYTVLGLIPARSVDGSNFGVIIDVRSAHREGAWAPSRFRKVQRRNIVEWLTQAVGIEEPKRVKKAVDA